MRLPIVVAVDAYFDVEAQEYQPAYRQIPRCRPAAIRPAQQPAPTFSLYDKPEYNAEAVIHQTSDTTLPLATQSGVIAIPRHVY